MTAPHLEPCPFCWSKTTVKLRFVRHGEKAECGNLRQEQPQVICTYCGACGPGSRTNFDAIELWNSLSRKLWATMRKQPRHPAPSLPTEKDY